MTKRDQGTESGRQSGVDLGAAVGGAIPAAGVLAGVDFGTVRVGIAVCDPSRIVASPLQVYPRGNADKDAVFFRQLVQEQQLVGFVVGLPLHSGGEDSHKAHEARDFGRWLSATTELPVAFYDERFTSQMAQQMMGMGKLTRKKRKQRIDKLAAQIILAGYLESSEGP